MLYAITLTYVRPKDEVQAHLDSHRQWLADEVTAGRILAAGPLESGAGGFILAFAQDRGEIDAMIRRDSFHVHGLATFDVQAFSAAIRAEAFPTVWAGDARAIR
ncbi:YciI family protein [Phenylobacterium aquaticum]|uniref:YciI family protein n=1 Tax=Phenylobacterium aquaticum TaxID=1763816 RepID=UPI001F5DAE32|nr:YciI family protein [Phenylobacterium aquaticum]MCI3133629.1 YciI family protein [Phenylobacterium aquaticum]